ncbi:MAG TPA: TolC family protein [Polyangiaceae bacterium]|nr:TolC family protein [Polyangiaceae bacterium]
MTSPRVFQFRRHLLSCHLTMAALVPFLWAAPAGATQPLETFLEAARQGSFDVREQRATVEQRDWEKESSFGRLLPAFSARGVYQRNQYAAVIPPSPIAPTGLTITPQDQFDAFLQLDVPIVDLSAYARYGQAKHLARASQAQLELSQNDVQRAVARAYYAYVGGTALVEAANRSVNIAEENLAFVTTRRNNGVATELDEERARAQVEQSKQRKAESELIAVTNARNLETVSGLSPTPVAEYPIDDLHAEPPLSVWLASQDTPSDRVQAELRKAADYGKKSAARSLLPTLSANGQEHFTNATGFTGRTSFYTVQGVLSWRFDYGTYATAEAQATAADVQAIRSEHARRNVEDDIFDAWQRVQTGIVKSASARAQTKAALRAEELALTRYQAGALTQLDVTQAQRDAFDSQASSIQADADLLYSRVLLRLASGKAPHVAPSTLPPVQAKDLGAAPGVTPLAPPPTAEPAPAPPPSAPR